MNEPGEDESDEDKELRLSFAKTVIKQGIRPKAAVKLFMQAVVTRQLSFGKAHKDSKLI